MVTGVVLSAEQANGVKRLKLTAELVSDAHAKPSRIGDFRRPVRGHIQLAGVNSVSVVSHAEERTGCAVTMEYRHSRKVYFLELVHKTKMRRVPAVIVAEQLGRGGNDWHNGKFLEVSNSILAGRCCHYGNGCNPRLRLA